MRELGARGRQCASTVNLEGLLPSAEPPDTGMRNEEFGVNIYILIHNFIRYTRKMKLAENTAFMQVSTLRNLRLFLRHDNSRCFYYY